MDLSMADGDGLTATRAITRGDGTAPRVLVLTMHAEEAYLERARGGRVGLPGEEHRGPRAGGGGARRGARRDLRAAPLRRACSRRARAGATSSATDRARFEQLTDRERAVMRLIAEGYTAPEIGEQLAISPKTVDTYKQRVNDKLGLTHRADYVKLALKLGLLGAA